MTQIEQQAFAAVARQLPRIASALERIAAAEERGVKALTRDDRRERP